LRTIYESRNSPTQINFLYATREEAVACPRGDIRLAVCGECDLIVNTAFDPSKLVYREGYENALHHSSVFQTYADTLVERLIAGFDLKKKTIVEVGCGDGTFLRSLCERGGNRGIGFDPSAPATAGDGEARSDIRIIRDYFSEAYADIGPDFVYSRHTLEHVWDPMTLLRPLRRTLEDTKGIPVFFEVPNGLYTLEKAFIWDIIYEHTTYFTEGSLSFAFERAGFDVTRTYEAFSGQFLCIESTVGVASNREIQRTPTRPIAPAVDAFEANHQKYVERWRETLADLAAENKTVLVWGAGSKGITFLNLFESASFIDYVVDLNPKKQGMFIAGRGQEIVPPERIVEIHPDAIIIVNPVYRDEIEERVSGLGVSTEYLVL
jgi:SAM-dependent methyltransferase